MSQVVFISYGITSYLNSSFRLADQLRARGHHITFISSFEAGRAVTAQGFRFVLLAEENRIRNDNERQQLEQLPARQRYLHRSALIRVGERLKKHRLESYELEHALQDLEPDLLLIDEELSHYIIASVKLGIPTLLLQYFISTRKAPNVPPLRSNIIPQPGFWSRLSVEAVWQVLLAQRKLIATFAPLYYKKTDWRSILKALAQRDNFAFSKRVEQGEGPPITFKDMPTMFFSAWEFDFPHEVKNKAYYVGPMVWLNRRETQGEADFSAALPEIQERRATSDHTRPLIYGSIGTFWLANADYVRRLIQVFAIRQDWDLVMSIGSSASVADFEPLPPNVRLFNSVPQLEMLQHADLMLTHGGISTINECIFLGVPMIVYSGGKIDQNGNAARVEYHGLGLRGNIHRESSAQIISKIERVLIEPQFKTNVHKMRQIYLAYHNSGKGVQIIESMLQQSPRGPRGEPDPALSNKVELS